MGTTRSLSCAGVGGAVGGAEGGGGGGAGVADSLAANVLARAADITPVYDSAGLLTAGAGVGGIDVGRFSAVRQYIILPTGSKETTLSMY